MEGPAAVAKGKRDGKTARTKDRTGSAKARKAATKADEVVPTDWESPEGLAVGMRVQHFFDLDGEWFSGRILRFDAAKQLHHISFDADNTTLDVKLDEEMILVETQVVWARVKGHPFWPASEWRWTEKTVGHGGFDLQGRGKGGHYVIFFGTEQRGWCSSDNVVPFATDHAEVEKRVKAASHMTKLKEAMNLASKEVENQRRTREAQMKREQKALNAVRKPEDWVGKTITHFRDDVNYPQVPPLHGSGRSKTGTGRAGQTGACRASFMNGNPPLATTETRRFG